MTFDVPSDYEDILRNAVASGAFASTEDALRHALELFAAERPSADVQTVKTTENQQTENQGISTPDWSDAANERRCQLIDKSLHSRLTDDEQVELQRLQQIAEEHFDRVAPPPIAGALELHAKLLKLKAEKSD